MKKNQILVKGLCQYLETKSEASVATLAGLDICVEHSVQQGAGCGQGQLSSGRAGSVLCWVSGRGGKGSQACGQEPHSQRGKWVQYVCILGILVSTPPTTAVSFPTSPLPDPANVDRPPPQGWALDRSYNLLNWKVQSYFLRFKQIGGSFEENQGQTEFHCIQISKPKKYSSLFTFIYITLRITYSIFLQNYTTHTK